jgi:hypothetical protein
MIRHAGGLFELAPFFRKAVMQVARKLWLPILVSTARGCLFRPLAEVLTTLPSTATRPTGLITMAEAPKCPYCKKPYRKIEVTIQV